MNKRIKRVIAIALTISAFSAVQPVSNFNLITTKAYASSSYVSNVTVNKAGGTSSLKLYRDSEYDRKTEFKSSLEEYYVKTSANSVNLSFDTEDRYVTYVFKDSSKIASPFESGEEIELSKGTTTLYVRTYKSSRFDKNNVKNDVVDEYEIHVQRKAGSSNDNIYLSKLSLDYGKISFSKNKTSYDVDVNSSVDQMEITAKPNKSNYTVRIDGTEVDEDDDYTGCVDLKKGKNVIEIEIRDEEGNENLYTLNIYRGGRSSSSSSSTSDENNQDAIYLDDLTLNNGDIDFDFNKKTTKYDIKVKSSVDEVAIKAKPKNEDYEVKVNNSKVNSDYKKTVSLENNKKNVVRVKLTKDDKQRTYTLNITRGTVSTNNETNTNSNSSTNANSNITNKSKWLKESNTGKWKYYDDNGKALKNQWHYDKNGGGWYYLESDEYMKTGWLFNANKWYLLDGNGAMKTGWLNDHGNWYYLNTDGSMKTGWLNDHGAWYYLSSNGIMKTGWLDLGNKKYYFNNNGTMQTKTITISGKSYNFDASGAVK